MTCGQMKELLMNLALDEAGLEERRHAEQHLATCEACRAQLADWKMTRRLVAQGAPLEQMPRRIAFVAASEAPARGGFAWARRRAFAVPLGAAAGIAVLAGALALAGTRVTVEHGRWEVAFGRMPATPGANAGVTAGAQPRPLAGAPVFTREQAAEMIAAAVRDAEQRQRAETAALLQTAMARQDKRHFVALNALAGQMQVFERTQNIFYKETDRARAALETVANRLPAPKETRQ